MWSTTLASQDSAVNHACTYSPNLAKLTLSLCAALVNPRVNGPKLRRVDLAHSEQYTSQAQA